MISFRLCQVQRPSRHWEFGHPAVIGVSQTSPTLRRKSYLRIGLGRPSSVQQDFSHLHEIPYAGDPIGNALAFKAAGAVEEEGLDAVHHRTEAVVLQAVAHKNGFLRRDPEAFGRHEIDVGIVLLETLLVGQNQSVLVEEPRQTVAVEDVVCSERPEIAVHAQNEASIAQLPHGRFDVPVLSHACTFALEKSFELQELLRVDVIQTKSLGDVAGEVLGVVDVGRQAGSQEIVVGVDADCLFVVELMPEDVLETENRVEKQRCEEREKRVGLKKLVLHSHS